MDVTQFNFNRTELSICRSRIIQTYLPLDFDTDSCTEACLRLMEASQGLRLSNRGQGWHSLVYDAHDPEDPPNDAMQKFFESYMMPMGQCISDRWGFGPISRYRYWYNVNRRSGSNARHRHPIGKLSGTFYLKVPEGSGGIKFHRDLTQTGARINKRSPATIPEDDAPSYMIEPTPRCLLFFPSNLEHEVTPNTSDDEDDRRISVAFDLI